VVTRECFEVIWTPGPVPLPLHLHPNRSRPAYGWMVNGTRCRPTPRTGSFPAGGRWTEYNGLMSTDNGLMATDKRLMSMDKWLMSRTNG